MSSSSEDKRFIQQIPKLGKKLKSPPRNSRRNTKKSPKSLQEKEKSVSRSAPISRKKNRKIPGFIIKQKTENEHKNYEKDEKRDEKHVREDKLSIRSSRSQKRFGKLEKLENKKYKEITSRRTKNVVMIKDKNSQLSYIRKF